MADGIQVRVRQGGAVVFAVFVTLSLRFVMVVGAVQLLLDVIGNNLYDLRVAKRRRQRLCQPYARCWRQRPLLSVIVVVRDQRAVIERCLTSISASSYRKLEVIVVDNASADGTRRQVLDFIAAHPRRRIKLLSKRVIADRFSAAAAGFKKFGCGELVVVLKASQTVNSTAFRNAVDLFNGDANLATLAPKQAVAGSYSSLGVLRRYQAVLGYRASKWRSALAADYTDSQYCFFRSSAFIARARINYHATGRTKSAASGCPWAGRACFASDVVIYDQAPASVDQLIVQTYRGAIHRLQALRARPGLCLRRGSRQQLLFTWFQLPLIACTELVALLIPLMLAYFAYVSLHLQEPVFLLSSAALLALFLGFAVWDDNQLSARQKLAYSFGIPVACGPFYVLSVVQAVALLMAGLNLNRPGRRSTL